MNLKQKDYFSLVSLIFALLFALKAHAQFSVGLFFKKHTSTLSYTTGPQSLMEGNCSGVLTIQNKNYLGLVTNVGADLTVNLSGPGAVAFYSDSSCTQLITSKTMATGTSSINVYFIPTATGSHVLSASATGYVAINQTETVTTNNFVWTGGGANANWSTAANWSGGVAPGSGNAALFNGTCVTNCSPTINSNINVAGVRIESGYSGTLTQTTGFTLNIGASGWVQLASNFVGSSGGDAITVGGPFTIASGSFKSTSGILTARQDWFVSSLATFTHNSGSVNLVPYSGYNEPVITAGNNHYNDFTFGGSCAPSFNLNSSTLNVDGTLTFNMGCTGGISSGSIMAYGNVSVATGGGASGSAVVTVAGKVGGQTITGTGTSTYIPNLIIAAGANDVTLSGSIIVIGDFTMASAGTLTTTGSTLTFFAISGANTPTISPGNFHYNNVTFYASCGPTYSLNNQTLKVNGTLTLNIGCQGTINSGTIMSYGNMTISASSGATGTAQVQFVGATDQTLTVGSGALFPRGNVTVATTAGAQLILGSAVSWNNTGQSTTVSTGSINMAGFALTVKSLDLSGNHLARNGGALTVNGSVFSGGTPAAAYNGTIDN